ncbi:MAG: MFS transporter, partial [bacterium]|nr:MFS transporter [bacterium]
GAALAGIMFLVSVLYGTTTREIKSTSTVKPTPSGRPAQIKALFRDVKLLYTDQRIRRVCLVFLLLDGAMASFFHLFSVYFTKHLGGSWFSTCLCMGIAGTLGALTFPLFGRLSDRYGRKPLVFYAIAGNFIMFVGFLLIRNTIALAVLYTLPVYSAIRVAARGYLADLTEESTRGGGMGLIGSIQSLASGIAPLIAGALAARYGLHVLPWTALSFLVLSGLTPLIFLEEYGQT